MKNRVLIVDKDEDNMNLLKSFLNNTYEVVTIDSGERAIEILNSHDFIDSVIINASIPDTDCYNVLKVMNSDKFMCNIPAIVIADNKENEIKALSFGAHDYIVKPINLEVLMKRISGLIKFKENVLINNASKYDSLTGLYNRNTFLKLVKEMVSKKEEGYYVLSCFDIDRFKVINDLYGISRGDEVIRNIGETFFHYFSNVGGICCRVNADNFAILYPAKLMDTSEVMEVCQKATKVDGYLRKIVFSVGRYVVDDKNLSPGLMYDRAMIAKATIKGHYGVHFAQYNEGMRERILGEQEIVSEMYNALENKQFEVWFQPQFNHTTGALIGSEALVRWRHPQKGLVSPGAFIPIFEQNGFVYEIDKYIWEQSCAFIRKQIDNGRKPVPVSVNVSRYDIFQEGFCEYIFNLVKKYNLKSEYLRIEITESAFAKSSDQIIVVVEKLKKSGFIVEIDDFGSGYSSLNTLKDVPADVLKLDMRFLEKGCNSDKGGNIVASIIRMAKWIGLTVIAEGVETIEQADFLKSVGCYYIQGYLYSKPLPEIEFEKAMLCSQKEESIIEMEKVETYNIESFWNPTSMDTLIFNTFVGGACIFEYHNGRLELLRVNKKGVHIIGGGKLTEEQVIGIKFNYYINNHIVKKFNKSMMKAIDTNDEVTDEIVIDNAFNSGKCLYIRIMLRVIAKSEERYLFYCLMEDTSEQRSVERENEKLSYRLKTIIDNMVSGVSAVVIRKGGLMHTVFANDQYYCQRGYSKTTFRKEVKDPLSMIYHEDRTRLEEECRIGYENKRAFTSVYRLVKRDGSLCWFRSRISYVKREAGKELIQIAISEDITKEMQATEKQNSIQAKLQIVMDNIGSGVCAIVIKNNNVNVFFANELFYEMRGYTKDEYTSNVTNSFDLVYESDRGTLIKRLKELKVGCEPVALEYRIYYPDKKIHWIRNVVCVTDYIYKDEPVQLSVFRDITEEKKNAEILVEYSKKLEYYNRILKDIMGDIPGGYIRLHILNDGRVQADCINDILCGYLNFTKQEILEHYKDDVRWGIHPDDIELFDKLISDITNNKEVSRIILRRQKKDGSYIPFTVYVKVSNSENNEFYVNTYYDFGCQNSQNMI